MFLMSVLIDWYNVGLCERGFGRKIDIYEWGFGRKIDLHEWGFGSKIDLHEWGFAGKIKKAFVETIFFKEYNMRYIK